MPPTTHVPITRTPRRAPPAGPGRTRSRCTPASTTPLTTCSRGSRTGAAPAAPPRRGTGAPRTRTRSTSPRPTSPRRRCQGTWPRSPGREEPRPRPGPTEGLPPRLQPGPGAADGSCSVLQMAKSLSEEEFGAGPRLPHEHGRAGAAFRTHPIRESIQEELAEEAVGAGGAVGVWLRALGLQRYEQGLVHNGWDDLEFLSDITEEDLEEAGVRDPGHKRGPPGEPPAPQVAGIPHPGSILDPGSCILDPASWILHPGSPIPAAS
ncbi:phosphatidylinositol 3,4,5-trisphosphate 5-phosphatase 2 [Pezoporus flaviventris]|uniref:phosphatidylinositol 3,4,5-trisphosphate 5-phosphatase 2 n=1 Tax=Pezoporus flaviventris TaxID=889875 RepID=UPI002AB2635F|nr:phosphatidylinositol 3,4,5-trisphosphate 5-phosphatase 2 [Pezoporus flaviventris]